MRGIRPILLIEYFEIFFVNFTFEFLGHNRTDRIVDHTTQYGEINQAYK